MHVVRLFEKYFERGWSIIFSIGLKRALIIYTPGSVIEQELNNALKGDIPVHVGLFHYTVHSFIFVIQVHKSPRRVHCDLDTIIIALMIVLKKKNV